MTDAKEYAAVFRAAAEGVMRPYVTQVKLPGGVTGVMMQSHHDSDGFNHDQSMARAFNAIANVFQQVVNAEKKEKKDET